MTDITQLNEIAIVRKMYKMLDATGWKLMSYDDGGDDNEYVNTLGGLLDVIHQTDEITLYFRKDTPDGGKTCFAYLIFGNGNYGLDLIADHSADTWGFAEVMDKVYEWINDKQYTALPVVD